MYPPHAQKMASFGDLADREWGTRVAVRADDVDLSRDRALVERFQAGDRAAFDELYRRYRDRLERFCLKRIGDRHGAEEVAQEAFTRALSAMPRFAGERRFYPWVTVIAARLCVDHHRRLARVEPAAIVDLGPVDGGQDAVLTAVDAALVLKAMDRLGSRHQEVLRLREMEGWSYQRIADEYGVNIGTVDALLFRARRALRREFENVGGALTAIPVLGGLLRVMGRMRDRTVPWLSTAPGAVGQTAAATAAAAAFAVGLTMVPGSAPRVPATPSAGPSHVLKLNPANPALTGPAGALSGQTPGSASADGSTPGLGTVGQSVSSASGAIVPGNGSGGAVGSGHPISRVVTPILGQITPAGTPERQQPQQASPTDQQPQPDPLRSFLQQQLGF